MVRPSCVTRNGIPFGPVPTFFTRHSLYYKINKTNRLENNVDNKKTMPAYLGLLSLDLMENVPALDVVEQAEEVASSLN